MPRPLDDEEYCPNCGQYTGGEHVCPNCGAILKNSANDDEFDGFHEDEGNDIEDEDEY